MSYKEMKMLTEVFTTRDELRALRDVVIDSCLKHLGIDSGCPDPLNPWDINLLWHDDLMTESSVTGVIRISSVEYDFHFNFDSYTIIRMEVADEIDPEDEYAVSEAEEHKPYDLFGNEGETTSHA